MFSASSFTSSTPIGYKHFGQSFEYPDKKSRQSASLPFLSDKNIDSKLHTSKRRVERSRNISPIHSRTQNSRLRDLRGITQLKTLAGMNLKTGNDPKSAIPGYTGHIQGEQYSIGNTYGMMKYEMLKNQESPRFEHKYDHLSFHRPGDWLVESKNRKGDSRYYSMYKTDNPSITRISNESPKLSRSCRIHDYFSKTNHGHATISLPSLGRRVKTAGSSFTSKGMTAKSKLCDISASFRKSTGAKKFRFPSRTPHYAGVKSLYVYPSSGRQ